jgi:aspartyl-tRNA(Asn)/glutamyl-tRNA(Gln) amidotransferase subunit A
MCLAALGSQTGGSITRPASYCGICGLKPTHGRVDVRGVVPLSRSLDHLGPLARSVADLRLLLMALADWQPEKEPLFEPPKLFVIREYFLERCDETIREVTLNALERLQQAGADLHSLAPPDSFQHVHAMHRCIMAVEAAETHFDSFSRQSDAYSSHIAALLEEGLTTFAVDYSLSLRHQHVFREQTARMLGDNRVAITPATMTPAPDGLQSTGDPAFNSPWSYAGVPTVTVPCGLSPDGLPCGLQLIGPPGREDLLLDTADWCEDVLDFRARPTIE